MPKKKSHASSAPVAPVPQPTSKNSVAHSLARIRMIDDFRTFTGTDQLIHTSKGHIDLADRHQRGIIA